jgi:hypothetical protein
MSKLLFLDVDGVLNRKSTKERIRSDGINWLGVDRELADRFLGWLEGKDLQIILSSTWRMFPDMTDGLQAAGIRWIDNTPIGRYSSRGAEIQSFMQDTWQQWPERYAILDDNGDMMTHQLPHLVRTETDEGLQERHLRDLDRILFPPE